MKSIGRTGVAPALAAFLVLFLLGVAWGQGGPVNESTLHDESVDAVAADVGVLVRNAVAEAGGDLENQQVHWVFVYSTGHFPGEPIRAQAARQTALHLLRDLAVPGDLVSSYAFEMEVWEHAGIALNPIVLNEAGDLDSVARSFPLTARAGSQGGHDTERALVDVAGRVDRGTGPVIVLIANRAASITTDPTARPLLGSDAPSYGALLDDWHMAPVSNRSGASYEATYAVTRWNGESVTNTLDFVVLVPKAFAGPATPGPRSELRRIGQLETEVPVQVEPASAGSFPFWVVVLLIAVAGGAYLVLSGKWRPGPKVDYINIGEHRIGVASLDDGVTLCRLVPRSYVDESTGPSSGPAVYLQEVTVGTEVLGRFVWSSGRAKFEDGVLRAVRWNDAPVKAPVVIHPPKGNLELVGEVRAGPGLPPKQVRTTIKVELGSH